MELKNLRPTNRKLIIRKVTLERKIGSIVLSSGVETDENTVGVIMAVPDESFYPDGRLRTNPIYRVGQTVSVTRGKVGDTLPAEHIPTDEQFSGDTKELWLVVPEDMINYIVET